MNTKLTLRLDEDLIRAAKRYSAQSGKSISRLIADYFTLIEAQESSGHTELTPRVRSLYGSLAGSGIDEQDYLRHLEDKYR